MQPARQHVVAGAAARAAVAAAAAAVAAAAAPAAAAAAAAATAAAVTVSLRTAGTAGAGAAGAAAAGTAGGADGSIQQACAVDLWCVARVFGFVAWKPMCLFLHGTPCWLRRQRAGDGQTCNTQQGVPVHLYWVLLHGIMSSLQGLMCDGRETARHSFAVSVVGWLHDCVCSWWGLCVGWARTRDRRVDAFGILLKLPGWALSGHL